MVLAFAILFPTTFRALLFALSPERAVLNENDIFVSPFITSKSKYPFLSSLNKLRTKTFDRLPYADKLIEGIELGELSHERGSVLRCKRILIL